MKEHLTQLILYDTEIKALNEKINDLKKSKRETEEYVKQCILNEHLQHKVFILNHKKIKYTETKTYQPFSFKYIEQRLGEWIDRESLTHIMKHLKDSRAVHIHQEIKILDYNNE